MGRTDTLAPNQTRGAETREAVHWTAQRTIYTIASEIVVERKTKLNEAATKDVNKEAQINTQEVTGKTIKNR